MYWLDNSWAKIGGLLSACILLCLLFSDLHWTDIKFLAWLHFCLLLLHQFEEYVYPGGFKDFFNKNILNKNRLMANPLNRTGIVLVNVLIAWSAYFLAALFSTYTLGLMVGLLLISLLNGVLHTALAIIRRQYNPGLFTGFFLFIPFCLFVFFNPAIQFTLKEWGSGVFIFIIGSFSIPLTIILSNKIKNLQNKSNQP